MDAIQLLKDDHDTVEGLFRELDGETANARKRQIGTRILNELEVHTQIEEEIFYPAVRELPDEKAHDMINEAYEEHRLAKDLIGELKGREPQEEMFDAQFKVLKENIEHHVQEEENEMFPHIRPLMRSRLDELGANMQRRKRELQTTPTSVTSTIRGLMNRAYEAVAGSEPTKRGGARKSTKAKTKRPRTAARARKSSRAAKAATTGSKRAASKKRATTKRAKVVSKSARSARSTKMTAPSARRRKMTARSARSTKTSARNSKRAGAVASGARKRGVAKSTPAKRARARRASRSPASRRR